MIGNSIEKGRKNSGAVWPCDFLIIGFGSHIPFVVLIDGYLRNDEFEAFGDELGLTTDASTHFFFHVGANGQLLSSLKILVSGLQGRSGARTAE